MELQAYRVSPWAIKSSAPNPFCIFFSSTIRSSGINFTVAPGSTEGLKLGGAFTSEANPQGVSTRTDRV